LSGSYFKTPFLEVLDIAGLKIQAIFRAHFNSRSDAYQEAMTFEMRASLSP
jgi:hypothetical protein